MERLEILFPLALAILGKIYFILQSRRQLYEIATLSFSITAIPYPERLIDIMDILDMLPLVNFTYISLEYLTQKCVDKFTISHSIYY